ncbi:MAG: hypothetical protein AAF480_09485 [Actinomycetota bacterium]
MPPRTQQLYAFFGGVPRRLPNGGSDAAVEARAEIARTLAELDAHMLGREADHRVPVDIDVVVARILDRMDRYTTADWDRGRPSNLEYSEEAMTTIAAHLRPGGGSTVDDEDAAEDD